MTLTCFRYIVYNGLVFESAIYFALLLCYLKNILILADGYYLNIYRVGRAANHQSNTDMENYEKMAFE